MPAVPPIMDSLLQIQLEEGDANSDASKMRTLTDSQRCAESLVVEDEGRGRSQPRFRPLIPVIASAQSQWRPPSEASSGGGFVRDFLWVL